MSVDWLLYQSQYCSCSLSLKCLIIIESNTFNVPHWYIFTIKKISYCHVRVSFWLSAFSLSNDPKDRHSKSSNWIKFNNVVVVIVRIYINIPSKLALCLRLNFFISANKNHPPFSFHSNSLEISHGLLLPMLSTSNSGVLFLLFLFIKCPYYFYVLLRFERSITKYIAQAERVSDWRRRRGKKPMNRMEQRATIMLVCVLWILIRHHVNTTQLLCNFNYIGLSSSAVLHSSHSTERMSFQSNMRSVRSFSILFIKCLQHKTIHTDIRLLPMILFICQRYILERNEEHGYNCRLSLQTIFLFFFFFLFSANTELTHATRET